MSRALRQWQVVVSEHKRKQEKQGRALSMMSPEGRARGKGFRAWFEYAKELRERKNKVKSALARMSPEGRAMYAGMTGFKSKSPSWLPGPNRHVSDDGFWVVSAVQKERESVYGTPEVQRGIFRFGFRINGSGAGLVVGVADATNRLMPAADCRAWGLHLAHGALYSKKQQSAKGVLSTKQLVPSMSPETPEDDPDMNFVENVIDIEVEVRSSRQQPHNAQEKRPHAASCCCCLLPCLRPACCSRTRALPPHAAHTPPTRRPHAAHTPPTRHPRAAQAPPTRRTPPKPY